MAKKIRVRMHCKVCNKDTVHEIRIVDGQESCVCLVCEAMPEAAENAAERNLGRYLSFRVFPRSKGVMEPKWFRPGIDDR